MKKAFTLAEVLITLGIIGIVAAMTLPTLLKKYQMKVFEVGFKKQYSVLNNAIDYLQLDGGLTECYTSLYVCPTEDNPNNKCYNSKDEDCVAFKQALINKLKLTKVINEIPYPSRAEVIAEGGTLTLTAYNYDGIIGNCSSYLLPDGAIVMFYDDDKFATNHGNAVFVIDVNGKKGPNKWGYDAFWLILGQKSGKIRLTDEYASLANKGGVYHVQFL